MYETHFGLTRRPFSDAVRGTDVFVGPQAAAAITGLKKALARPDAVATVAGPAGSGKTTLVMKALEALGPSYKAFRIGRMHLSGADAIEFLLEALGVTKLPQSAVKRFNTFRRVLSAAQAENIRIVVVIEDAMSAGTATLAELEALTAADSGLSDGANLVLMGNDKLSETLRNPQLERIVQRTRHRQSVVPMGAAELRGYLMHAFRQAGADLEAVLAPGAVDVLHELSGGNPRMANNVLEAGLSAAARAGERHVNGALLAAVANEEFGLEAVVVPTPVSEPGQMGESDTPVPKDAVAATEPAVVPEPEAETPVLADDAPASEPVIVFSDEPLADEDADDIPELIQDTLPDLAVLTPELAGAVPDDEAQLPTLEVETQNLPELEPIADVEAEPEPIDIPEPEALIAREPEPAPVAEAAAEPEPARIAEAAPPLDADHTTPAEDVPEWERDPTLAELKPDLDALEKAMAFAHGETGENTDSTDDDAPDPARAQAEPEEIPEITLDHAIQERIENSLIDEPGEISPMRQEPSDDGSDKGAISGAVPAPKPAKKADAEIERIAAELAKAKTIEDVDDKLAETLFGEEINLIAAQVVANAQDAASANDEELQLFDTAAAQKAQAAGTRPGSDAPTEDDAPPLEVSLETPEDAGEGGLDLSASQRLKTVRALNADLHPSLREPGNGPDPGPDVPAREVATPEPIEDQINTSMTQTLKALNVHPPTLDRDRDDDEGDGKKSGFFSRFRRS